MRLQMDSQKLESVIKSVQEYIDADENAITDFIDGGSEGWECGDDDQQGWINNDSVERIADWVIAGLN